MRIKVYFLRGSDVTVDCARVGLVNSALVAYRSGAQSNDKELVVAEFYQANIVGWKRED